RVGGPRGAHTATRRICCDVDGPVAPLHVRARLRRIMPRRTSDHVRTSSEQVLDAPDQTLLDVLDQLLNKGVMLTGDVTLGVAGVDLIYLRLSSILCAVDRVLPPERGGARKRSRHRNPSAGRHRR